MRNQIGKRVRESDKNKAHLMSDNQKSQTTSLQNNLESFPQVNLIHLWEKVLWHKKYFIKLSDKLINKINIISWLLFIQRTIKFNNFVENS